MRMGKDLTQENPAYKATKAERIRGRDFFEGARVIKEKKTAYLFREKNEAVEDYNKRLSRAVFDPYSEKIITARQAVLFSKPATRELGGLEEWAGDVDNKGTDANSFFFDVAENAQADGIHWVAVDHTKPDKDRVSKADEDAAGDRPFFEQVAGAAVIDWEVGTDLELNWAVVKQTATKARATAGEEIEAVEQWKIWYRDRWEIWQRADEKDKTIDKFKRTEWGAHPCEAVPLIPWLGKPRTSFSGWPITMPVHGHILAVYNQQSDRDWFMQLASHPLPVVIGPQNVAKLDTGKGMWLKSMAGETVDIKYLEPAGTAVDGVNEVIETYQRKIFALMLFISSKDTAQVQSADSQREDRRVFTSSLSEVSVRYESNENQCWDLMGKWTDPEVPADATEVKYSRDFDDKFIEATMISALTELVGEGVITKRTALQAVVAGELVEVEDIDAELAAAAQEAKARTEELTQAALASLRRSSGEVSGDE